MITCTIPTLETERLSLRAMNLSDLPAYSAFRTGRERTEYLGGPITAEAAKHSFFALSGTWLLRGYGLFVATLKSEPSARVGGFGIYHPAKHEEPEFGWSVWSGAFEGKGFVTEAMRTIIPWAWSVLGVKTAQSHIDAGNDASAAVARALGAVLDTEQTQVANAEGGEFYAEDVQVNIWRHHKGALT